MELNRTTTVWGWGLCWVCAYCDGGGGWLAGQENNERRWGGDEFRIKDSYG